MFRNGPNPQFPGADPHAHWFTRDCMIHSLTVRAGRAAYCNRWIRTERFEAERRAGRPIFPGFAPSTDPAAEGADAGVANTNIIWHAGLPALEEAHLPVAPHFDAVAAVDHQTGGRALHTLTAGDALSEPVFVPAAADAEEGVGFILTVAWRAAENRSDLLVLDAQNVGAPPLATVELPCRVPFGFRGNWLATEGEPS